jgi:sulfotransferase family protein
VFLLGMTKRTGTNFLYDLLALHPDLTRREPIWEDASLASADHLDRYVRDASRLWPSDWDEAAAERSFLLKSLGDGVVSFLTARAEGKQVVTKMPSLRNLDRFFELFPEQRLLLVVRDGRSAVESSVRSFGETYAKAIRDWADSARAFDRFRQGQADHPAGFHVVRYERLLTDLEDELGAALRFCGLSTSTYDFEAARALPLRGSSTHRGEHIDLHWSPVPRPADFGGLERWSGWSTRRHREFNLLAGELLTALGYEPSPAGPPGLLLQVRATLAGAGVALARHFPFRTVAWYRRKLRRRRLREAA